MRRDDSMSEPLHIISLGAGVQSSTMALMAAAGEITPMPHCAIFADTQDEPASVYRWLDWLEKQLPFPVHRVTAGSLSGHIFKAIREQRRVSKPPLFTEPQPVPAHIVEPDNGDEPYEVPAHIGPEGILTRDCTRDFKVAPIQREVRRVMREAKAKAVIQWIGISLDEVQRMKSSRVKYSTHRFPLIEMELTRHDCLRWIERAGFETPPRSACVYCPHHSNATWRKMKYEHDKSIRDGDRSAGPSAWQQAVEFDRAIRTGINKVRAKCYVHRSCVPLDQVDLSTDTERGQGMLAGFGNECEGMCGV
jgi:hypothetical protein